MNTILPSDGRKTRAAVDSRFVPLRLRFIVVTIVMLVVVFGMVALVLGWRQGRTIQRQVEARGQAIAQSLAAIALSDLLTYNTVALERSANQAARDPDIVYVIFHDKEGRVAGYSAHPHLQHHFLADEASQQALAAAKPLRQRVTAPGGDSISGLEIALPVLLSGDGARWGTVRVCLSLDPMHKQIRQMRLIILLMGLLAVAGGTLMAGWAAGRITRPLHRLVEDTQRAARGELAFSGRWTHSGDEVEVLAANFAAMVNEILANRQQLENRLAEIKRLQSYTDELLTTMNDGLLSVDLTGRIATVNPSANRMIGDRGGPLVKDGDIHRAVAPWPELADWIRTTLQHPEGTPYREIRLERENRPQVLLVGASLLRRSGGRVQEVIFSLHDVTLLKALEASVRQAERLAGLGTLAAGMAHEIRNPLSTIKTFVQLLPRKQNRSEFMAKFQRTVPRELERINGLVEQLLELVRVPHYDFRPMDAVRSITETMDFMEAQLTAGRVAWRLVSQPDLPAIQADSGQLATAFQNIVRNAIQAMPNGGRLTVTVRRCPPADPQSPARQWLCIDFEDTGSGIDDKDIRQIFNPFYTTKVKGTGLGLATTHKVVSEHGGAIEVRSRPGRGTRMTLRLPV